MMMAVRYARQWVNLASASDDSNLVQLLLQAQLKLVIKIKRLVPATKQPVSKRNSYPVHLCPAGVFLPSGCSQLHVVCPYLS